MVDFADFIFDCVPTITDIKLLSDIIFGNDYLSDNQVEEFLENPNYILTTVCHKERFIGVYIQFVTVLNDLDERVKKLLIDTLGWEENQKIIWHKQTFLAPAYQGMGIGKELVNRSEKKVEKFHLPHVSIIWNYEGNKIIPLFEKTGYKKIANFPEFWKNDSLEKKYSCNICGLPCKCEALIMVKLP